MSESDGLARCYAAIEKSAGLMDVACSRDTVWPILDTYADVLPRAVIAFRVATGARDTGEFNCRFLSLPSNIDPYARALSQGLVARTDHPVGALLSNIYRWCPIDGYGLDFGVVGGFQKTWSFFPEDDFQSVKMLAGVPSMPSALAEHVDFFASRGLERKVSLLGIDYEHRTANVYFGDLPDGCLEPDAFRSMHRGLGLPEPSERMLRLGPRAFGFYVTLSWDSPKIERMSVSVMTPDLATLPVRCDPKIGFYMRSIPYGADDPKIVYAAMTSTGEEYYKVQSYYRWRPRILHLMRVADSV